TVHELAYVIVAHWSRNEQQLPFLDLALKERLTGPGALERTAAAVVPQHRAEHPETLARGKDARAHHPADARHLLADLHVRQGRDRRGVEIAMGRVVQQVADAPNAEPGERFRALRADALQVFHRRGQRQRHALSPFPLPRPFTRSPGAWRRTGRRTPQDRRVPRRSRGTGPGRAPRARGRPRSRPWRYRRAWSRSAR